MNINKDIFPKKHLDKFVLCNDRSASIELIRELIETDAEWTKEFIANLLNVQIIVHKKDLANLLQQRLVAEKFSITNKNIQSLQVSLVDIEVHKIETVIDLLEHQRSCNHIFFDAIEQLQEVLPTDQELPVFIYYCNHCGSLVESDGTKLIANGTTLQ